MPKIRVLDTETQGIEADHLVCELGWCDLDHDGTAWRIGPHGSSLHRVDFMPPEAQGVHHISAEETHPFAPFHAGLMWAQAKLDSVDVVAAHYMQFDAARFGEPQLPLLCTWKAALRVWPTAPNHKNGTLRYWLQHQGLISPEHEHTLPPHRAGPDAYVTAHILMAALQHAKASEMVAWTKEPPVLPTCTIGEWRGKPWSEVDAGFLGWMIRKPVEPDLVWNAQRELDRRRTA